MSLDASQAARRSAPGGTDPARRAALGACGAAALLSLIACTKQEAVTATDAAPATPPTPPTPQAPATGQARQAFDSAARGVAFDVGEAMAARQMQVFFDPQCPHCGALWKAARPLGDRVHMRWMPVAFMNPNSAPQGAVLLKAADPAALMDEHEALLLSGQGGLKVIGPADAGALADVKSNTALWQSLNAGSVPYAVYRAGNDGPYGVQAGQATSDELSHLLAL